MKWVVLIALLAAMPAFSASSETIQHDRSEADGVTPEPSDDEIRQILIQQSIRSYSGSCPCPYNSARNGSRCGGRSAYSKRGGEAPFCHPADISDDMVRQYKTNE